MSTVGVGMTYDDRQLFERFGNPEKKLAYATVNAIRSSLFRGQSAIQAHTLAAFTVRAKTQQFVMRSVAKIEVFPSVSQGRPYGEIAVDKKTRLLLAEFESGGTRPKFGPGKNVAIPSIGGPARPSWTSSVPAAFSFANLSIVKVRAGKTERTKSGRLRRERVGLSLKAHTTKGGKIQFKGARRTFILPASARLPFGGLLQRVGPGRDDVRLVYSFDPPGHLAAKLDFVLIMRQVADTWFAEELQREAIDAIGHGGFA